jgi:hypothetical protein
MHDPLLSRRVRLAPVSASACALLLSVAVCSLAACSGPATESASASASASAPLSSKRSAALADFCKGNEKETALNDGTVPANAAPGFTEAHYFPVLYENTLTFTAEDTDLGVWKQKMLREAQQGMRRKLADWISKRPDLWPYNSGLRDSLDDKNAPESWPDKNMPITTVDQRGTVDCVAGTYFYRVVMTIPRSPLDEMPELARVIEDGVRGPIAQEFARLKRDGVVTIHVPGIALTTLRDRVDRHRINEAAERYGARVKYLDEETQLLIRWLRGDTLEVSPFVSADYSLSSNMSLILNILSSAFLQAAAPGVAYDVQVVGRADTRRLGSKPYSGGADLSLTPGDRVPFRAGRGTATLTGNQQLSIARGYAAAEALEEHLRGKARIKVLYGGDGEVPGTTTDAGRRLEITIRKVK